MQTQNIKPVHFEQVPAWASDLTSNQFKVFQQEVNLYFYTRNIPFTLYDGYLVLDHNLFGKNQTGLTNLVQSCRSQGVEQIRDTVIKHFDSIFRALEFNGKLTESCKNFENMQNYLGVRLYDGSYINQISKEDLIKHHLGGNLYEVLIFDLPDAVINVHRLQTSTWQLSDERLLEIGRKNIERNYQVKLEKVEFGEVSVQLIYSPHFYSAQWVSQLHNKPSLIGKHGTLVSCPTRHNCLFYPIDDKKVLESLPMIITFTHQAYKQGPGSLSNELLWYNNGKFIALPYIMIDYKIEFFPPEEFNKFAKCLENDGC